MACVPLCGYDWKSVEELIRNIEENHTIDAVISDLSEQYEKQVKKEREILERVAAQKNELRNAIRSDMLTKQNEISFNSNRIEDNRKSIHRIQDEQDDLASEIEKYADTRWRN